MAEHTDLVPLPAPSMSMESFQCDTFALQMRFQKGDLKAEEFLRAASERGIDTSPDEDGDVQISVMFKENINESPYHAHLTMTVRKDGRGKADLSYHPGEANDPIEPPPGADECAEWLGGFLTGEVTTHIHVDYTFDESFTSAVSLNFPLPTSEKSLAGAVVSGLSFVLPTASGTSMIVQTGDDNETYIFLRETLKQELKNFRLYAELRRRSELVYSVMKKTGK